MQAKGCCTVVHGMQRVCRQEVHDGDVGDKEGMREWLRGDMREAIHVREGSDAQVKRSMTGKV